MIIKTKLTLARMDKDYRLLEKRELPSHSWTRGLLELLYLYSARIPRTSPYNLTPVDLSSVFDGSIIPISSDSHGAQTLRVATGGGSASYWDFFSTNEKTRVPFLNGADIGICVGTDNTPVIPTDRRLGHKIGNGLAGADGGVVSYTGYALGEDGNGQTMYVNRWSCQPFFASRDFRCSEVQVKIWRNNNPGNLTVEIRPMTYVSQAYSRPDPTTILATGTILEAAIPAGSPGAFVTCNFGTPVDLYAGHWYYLILHCAGGDAANYVEWRWDNVGATYEHAPTGTYESPAVMETTDGGINWTEAARCFMFDIRGQSQGEFEYGGCEVSGITIAPPSASFVIRRFFYNHSGGALTVEEVGILSMGFVQYVSGPDYTAKPGSIVIARDLTGGIAVADNELLLVTYTTSITV